MEWFFDLISGQPAPETHLPQPMHVDTTAAHDDDLTSPPFIIRLDQPLTGSITILERNLHFAAFSSLCTHMGCQLLRGDSGNLKGINYTEPRPGGQPGLTCGPCPCHGTLFDLTRRGLVIDGPASQRLPQLILNVKSTATRFRLSGDSWVDDLAPTELEKWPA